MPVTVLARNFHLAGDAGQRFDPVLRDAAGVVAGAASDDVDILDAGEHLGGLRSQRVGDDPAAFDATVERIGQRARLLENLLEHEMSERTFLRGIAAPLSLVNFALHGLAVGAEDIDAVARDLRDVALFEINKALRHRQQRRHAARDEVLADAEADDERARDAADHETLRVLRIDDQQRKRTGKPGNRFLHRLRQTESLLQVVIHEMRRNLGIGFRYELVAFRLEFLLDLLVVFDDAVMNNGDTIAGQVRVGVCFRYATVGRPARMGHADQAAQRIRFELLLELDDFAHRLGKPDRPVALQDCDTRRVVATILEAPETLDEYRDDVSFGDCTDYSAHKSCLLIIFGQLFFVGRFQPFTVSCLLRSSAN